MIFYHFLAGYFSSGPKRHRRVRRETQRLRSIIVRPYRSRSVSCCTVHSVKIVPREWTAGLLAWGLRKNRGDTQRVGQMSLNDVSGQIVDAAMRVHSALGPGLLESAYEKCMLFELHRRGLQATAQVALPIVYQEVRIDAGYRIDLLV